KIAAVRSPGKIGDVLSVVRIEIGDAASFPVRRFGDPDIAPAALVQKPGDAVSGRRCNQIGRERRAHDLVDREGAACSEASYNRKGNSQEGFHETPFWHVRARTRPVIFN